MAQIVKTIGELKKILEEYPDDMVIHGFDGNGGSFKPFVELQGYIVYRVGTIEDGMIVTKNDPIFKNFKGNKTKTYKALTLG